MKKVLICYFKKNADQTQNYAYFPILISEDYALSRDELYDLLNIIKTEYPDKDIWIYTGFYYDDFNDAQLHVLQMCDVLIDGPYINDERDTTLPFRGSRNQNIIYLKT